MQPTATEPVSEEQTEWFADSFGQIVANVEEALVGKQTEIRLVLTSFFSEGHVLIEDTPGTGKTVLAEAIANCLLMSSNRVQMSTELRPADIVGTTHYDQKSATQELRRGPIFAEVVLIDQINHATPMTQGAVLEAMENGYVTVGGEMHELSSRFFVIATQNRADDSSSFPLSQGSLDRFMMKISLGYPDDAAAEQLILGSTVHARARAVNPVLDTRAASVMTALPGGVFLDPSIARHINEIIRATQRDEQLEHGASMRGAMHLAGAVRTWAISKGRSFVTPEDVRDLAPWVLAHRVVLTETARSEGKTPIDVIERIVLNSAPPSPWGA